jgi:hypothetical protein
MLNHTRTLGAIVLPAKGDAGVVGGNETAVRDGDPVGIAGEISQHLLGSGERRLAIDHPFDAPQRGEVAFERLFVGQRVRPRDRLRRHPQERQHSAAAGGKAGPSASGEGRRSALRQRSRARSTQSSIDLAADSAYVCESLQEIPNGPTEKPRHPVDRRAHKAAR